MPLTIRNVQYHPGAASVACLCEHPLGQFYINVTQDALSPTGGNWGDADVLAAVTAAVAVQYPAMTFVVALPVAA
jgi:hypothetical protein